MLGFVNLPLFLQYSHPLLFFSSIPMQFELLTSMKSLHKHIDSSQLPLELDGTFPYCHRDWLSFRMVSRVSRVLWYLREEMAW